MKIAQFLAAGIALASATAFAAGNQRSSQSTEPHNAQPSAQHAQAGQSLGAEEDHDTIKQAQEKLSSMGHNAGPADGIMGPKTEAALKEFQQSKGLQASGQLDGRTLAALQVDESRNAPSARSSGSRSTSGQSNFAPPTSSQSPGSQSMSGQSSSGQSSQPPAPAPSQQRPSSSQSKY